MTPPARIPPGEDLVNETTPPWRMFDSPGAPGTDVGVPADPGRPGGSGGSAAPGRNGAPVPADPAPPTLVVAGAVVVVMALAAAATWLLVGGGSGTVSVDSGSDAAIASDPAGDPTDRLVIDVAGAVLHPGVYRLAPGSRVGDAIAAAGGYGPRVDAARAATTINLAAPLVDGAQVLVPSRDDVPPGAGTDAGGQGGGGAGGGGAGGLVDLNRATQAELEALPGIGPVTATKILSARAEAPFTSVDDLRTRKLVGQKTFDGLRDLVTVR